MKTPESMETASIFVNRDMFNLNIEMMTSRARLMLWTLRTMTTHLNLNDDNNWYAELSEMFLEMVVADLERATNIALDVEEERRKVGEPPFKTAGVA